MNQPIPFDNSYARLPDGFFEHRVPSPSSAPQLIAVNDDLARLLRIDPAFLRSADGLAMLAGNAVADGSEPIAAAYAGHQFGNFVTQLGDGRAILLGEVIGTDGIRRDIQLKGSGRTRWSRGGDGRAAIGPVIREYLVSEAMHALGVPTTRALAAVTTGDAVLREDGPLPGAILARVAQSHLRVGTFEYFAARNDTDALRTLADYAIARHYPDATEADHPYDALLRAVGAAQARLVARWMQLGFIHGVMNTDNCAIGGETIDYGPCAFMDGFDPGKVFSSIDRGGRYAWANQGRIAHWNLSRLAQALLPLLGDGEDGVTRAQAAVDTFPALFEAAHVEGFSAKLGLRPGMTEPIDGVFSLMAEGRVDYTLFFRHLTVLAQGGSAQGLEALFADTSALKEWLPSWQAALSEDAGARMAEVNPIYIPRNHRVEAAIVAAQDGDFSVFERLGRVLAAPYTDRADFTEFEAPPQPEEEVRRTFCGT
ncbi:uncharacterized protein YdiU (UPF0061 family) [Rubricella aquisinus]|uniref:Protein nucleotidyltransferase YdiU n=1 Tax=Rubricella aquisinus TaxID=2028108 RepID=A0A840WY78_9RHOB|nr:YdiU family protein [Rubricella aquisinus]MBB5514626.1 uncharacterized protein YdiU (UPF0061 family) [Rubricella aquisinus]